MVQSSAVRNSPAKRQARRRNDNTVNIIGAKFVAWWSPGPVFGFNNLRDAKAYVERYTPVRKSKSGEQLWTAEWMTSSSAGRPLGRGVSAIYCVKNSKGTVVNQVIITSKKKGR